MKRCFVPLFVFALALSLPAQKAPLTPHSKHGMNVQACMLSGLEPGEKNAAQQTLKRLSQAERAVVLKRGRLCMRNRHQGVAVDSLTDDARMKHFVGGLKPAEQTTLRNLMKRLESTPRAMMQKMLLSCCTHGLERATR